MKFFLSLVIILLFSDKPSRDQIPSTRVIAKCYGYSPCNACSNCSACKHCTAGGTCGVCTKIKTKPPVSGNKAPDTKPPARSGQCKATTQKGTRCSRSSRSGGYCWQHGG